MTMGTPHYSEPATDYDKKMSKVHKKNRKMIEKISDPKEKLEKSVSYNIKHRDQHQDALVKSKEQLKMIKKKDKSSAKMFR